MCSTGVMDRRYGYEPQRVAVWIYWQALLLLRKGVPFYGPPSARQKAEIASELRADDGKGRRCWTWRPASGFPWTAE
jgi:hypothetical protein